MSSILYSKQTYEEGEVQGTIAELMTEKVELVAQNKKDLVSEELLMDIMDRIDL